VRRKRKIAAVRTTAGKRVRYNGETIILVNFANTVDRIKWNLVEPVQPYSLKIKNFANE